MPRRLPPVHRSRDARAAPPPGPTRRPSRRLGRALAAAAVSAGSLVSRAAEKDWKATAGSGNWTTPGNWQQGTAPAPGDDPFIVNADATNRVVTFDYTAANIFGSVHIDNTGTGTNTLSQAANLLFTQTEYVGFSGRGVHLQSGGGNSALIFLDVGRFVGSTGLYNQTGGTLTAPNIYIGDDGAGTFLQNGTATVTATGPAGGLYLGYSATGSGTYALGAGGTLAVTQYTYVGYNGNGVFNQTGGSHTAGTYVDVGVFSGANGAYNQTGGSLTTASLYVGDIGQGTFAQSGAAVTTVTGTNSGNGLHVGRSGNGTYTLGGGGTLSANIEYIGEYGIGLFNQTGGNNNPGSNNSGRILFLGYGVNGTNPASLGTYNLSNGASLNGFQVEYVGYSGMGIFNQTGGSNSANNLELGYNANGTNPASLGTYNLSNGSLNVAFVEDVGHSGIGVFNQTGGSNTISSGFLSVAPNSTYNLGGDGASLSVRFSEEIGGGVFNQTGGSNTTGTLTLASTGIGATYNMGNGASLSASNREVVGYARTGVFNQTGGSNATGSLSLAEFTGIEGTYNMSNGASLSVSGSEFVGNAGNGVFNQTGGAHSVAGSLYLANGTASAGVYNLSNGASLNIGNSEFIGNLGPGVFNQSGGAHSVAGMLVISNTPGTSSGAFNLSGGTLTAGAVFVNSGGTVNVTAGTFQANAFYQNGGTVTGTGTIQCLTLFSYTSGTFTGRLLNQGSGQFFGNFTAGNGVENVGTIALSPAQSLVANGAGFDNEGTFVIGGGNLIVSTTGVNNGALNLAGGTLSGPGSFTNGASGALLGPGSITLPFANAGGFIAVRGGALNVTQPWANLGIVQMLGTTSSLIGGVLSNAGSIQGAGSIASALLNAGTVEALGGTLALTGAANNAAAGVMRVTTGNTLLVTQGLGTNAGFLTLAGGTFDNNGKPLTNNGVITGYGTLSTGGLTNNPGQVITFAGGLMTVNGPVTNSGGATIRANYAPALFTGPVVNDGTIKTTGTVVTFASAFSGAGEYLSDPSDNYFQSDVTIFPGGQILGAVGDRFFINGTYVSAGTYSNNGGSLSAQNVLNTGSLNQLAGPANMLALSGTGATTVGGGAGTAVVSVSSLSQGAVTINSGGTLTIRPAASRLTNTATNLQINGSGTLDLNNHELLTNTAPNTIKSYLASAYDPNGNADWGQHGLTSSVARANPVTYSVGYANGSDPSAQDAGVTTHNGTPLGANQTVIRPVLTGDANMDGVVDFFDITQILGYKYNTNQQASYTDGDLDYSGKVDFFDIVLLLSANYNSGQSYLGAHAAAPTLTGAAHQASSTGAAVASATTIGVTGDGKPDFEYDPATGHLRFRTDGGTFTTTGGSASFVSSLTITSASGILLPGGASNPFATGTGATLTSTLLSSALTNTPGFTDGFDIGIVLAPGLDAAALTADLTVKYQSLNGGQLKIADVTFIPEPASLGVISLAVTGLMGRSRRRTGRRPGK